MKDKYKYCDIIDKRYLLLLDLGFVLMCTLMVLSSPLKFVWSTVTILWLIVFIIELVQIIKIWRKKDV